MTGQEGPGHFQLGNFEVGSAAFPPFFVLFVSQKFAVISGLDSMTRPEGPGECQFGNFNAHHVICIIGFLVMENSDAVIHAFVIEFEYQCPLFAKEYCF